MEVILNKDVENLGYVNDIVSVKPGYANNYLIPRGIAKAATASAKKVLAEDLRQCAHKEAKLVADAEALVARLADIMLFLKAKAGEGKIFGSITSAQIAEALAERGISVDRKNISLETVKVLGEYEATVKVYKNIKGTVKFTVAAEE